MDGVGEGRMKIKWTSLKDRKGEAAGGNGEHERWVRGAGCGVRAGGENNEEARRRTSTPRCVFLMCVVSVSVALEEHDGELVSIENEEVLSTRARRAT